MDNLSQSPSQVITQLVSPSDILASMAINEVLDRLEAQILRSYAHNSLLYAALEKIADLQTITHFLRWDSQQPAFYKYLQQWLGKCPPCILKELEDHIALEINERHSELFREMMAYLNPLVPAETFMDDSRADKLNYTFSAECAREQDIGFFLGSFWATEIMSAKRCGQLYRGLRRNDVPDSALTYMHIHFEADANHGDEVRAHFIQPALQHHPELLPSIRRGVHDRLNRSSEYLMWYEATLLPDIERIAP